MRVVMVTNNALEDKIGGHERYVRELATALVAREVSVTIVAKRWGREAPPREVCADGVVIERHAVPSKRNPLYAPLYPIYVGLGVQRRVAAAAGPRTIVHAHMSVPALALAFTPGRYVFTFHAPIWRELLRERQGSWVLPRPTQGAAVETVRKVEQRVVRRAAATVVLSDFMREELRMLDARAGAEATVVPGAIDGERFSPGPVRRELVAHGGPTLFTARRLTPRTGVDELLLAMPAILSRHPSARLAIAGSGRMREDLEQLARELSIGHVVEFLGRISDAELVDWYRSATLVVMPTRELEGFGLTTAEALACGTPVVGTPVGATPELLRPIDPALVTADASGAAIATTINRLLSDREQLQRIRSRARERVLPAMGWDRVADRYLELYEALA